MLQQHINDIWLPTMQTMLVRLSGEDHARKALQVIKLHMLIRHACDRLMTHGNLLVRTHPSPT